MIFVRPEALFLRQIKKKQYWGISRQFESSLIMILIKLTLMQIKP